MDGFQDVPSWSSVFKVSVGTCGALGARSPDAASPSLSWVTSLTCPADNLRVFLPAKAWVSYPGTSSFLMRAGPMLGMSPVVCLQLGIETQGFTFAPSTQQHSGALKTSARVGTAADREVCWQYPARGKGLPLREKWTKR